MAKQNNLPAGEMLVWMIRHITSDDGAKIKAAERAYYTHVLENSERYGKRAQAIARECPTAEPR